MVTGKFLSLFLATVICTEITPALTCTDNSDCQTGTFGSKGKVCCSRVSLLRDSCRSDCIGQACYSDNDCGGSGEVCCTGDYTCRTSCLGRTCIVDGDCSADLACCRGNQRTCQSECVGQSCSFDFQCASGERCCSSVCQKGLCAIPGWAIALITLIALGFVGSIVGVLCYYLFCRRRSPGIVVSVPTSAPAANTFVASGSNFQGTGYPTSQPVQQGPPPAYYPPKQ